MLSLILLVIGLGCFLLASINFSSSKINLGWVGLFFIFVRTLL